MKLIRIAALLALFVLGCGLDDFQTPDGEMGTTTCTTGYTRRAVKVSGHTSWGPSPCRVSQCVQVGRLTAHTQSGCGILCAPAFIFKAEAGALPLLACHAEVNNGPWTAP